MRPIRGLILATLVAVISFLIPASLHASGDCTFMLVDVVVIQVWDDSGNLLGTWTESYYG